VLAVHFGAGNIGKGFVGNLLHKSGYHVCFVDLNIEVINEINVKKAYEVVILDNNKTKEIIENVSALNIQTQENEVIEAIVEADIVTTAVGASNLKYIAEVLAKGLIKRAQLNRKLLNVIACENAINASSILKDEIYKHLTEDEKSRVDQIIGFPNSSIDRLALKDPNGEKTTVWVEPFYEWIINDSEMVDDSNRIQGATYVKDLKPYLERKFFSVNTGHAITAYLGYLRGAKTIQTALKDPFIYKNVRGALEETGTLLIRKHGFNPTEHNAYIEQIIDRFQNPNVNDDVTRVGRAPIRKLGPNERLVSPARQLIDMNLDASHLALGIAAAILYDNNEDEESIKLQATLQEKGLKETILLYTELEKDHLLVQLINRQIRVLTSYDD